MTSSFRARCLAWSSLCLLGLVFPATAKSQADPRAVILGSWRGTSTCVDKVAFPSCHDEVVIYDVRPAASRDSVILAADKIVNGVRDPMGEYTLGRAENGAWVSEMETPRFHLRLTLTIAGSRMTGALIQLPSGRHSRAMALQRVPT
jgi:hypothetical protein